MERRKVIKNLALLSGGFIMSNNLATIGKVLGQLPEQQQTMPALFMGHGSPMNAIEDNYFTRGWKEMVKDIPKPKAIVCISAHWETRGSKVTAMQNPKMIYDMYGFPQELYEVQYPAPGAPELAAEIHAKVPQVQTDHHWGFDHGTWSVLTHAFPQADIPCIQLSLNKTREMNYHYELGKQLASFRKKGVLFVGSGNIVHNLPYIFRTNNKPADWAISFDSSVERLINKNDHKTLLNYSSLGKAAELSVNSAEHYLPLLYILALKNSKDPIRYYNHEDHSSLLGIGMRCVKIG